MNPDTMTGVLIPIAFLIVAWGVTYAMLQNRTKQEAKRVELHSKLLDRIGSAREFGEFLSSPAGERFLQSLAPARPTNRAWSSLRTGIFTSIFGLMLLAASFWDIAGKDSHNMTLIGLLTLAFGVASLVSVAVSRAAARRLGIDVPVEERSGC